jgi:hypothetical protein
MKIRLTEDKIRKIVAEAIMEILDPKTLMNEDAWEDAWADDRAEIEEVFRKNGWEIEKLLEKNGASYYFMSRSSEHNGTTPKQIVRQLNVALGGNGKAEHLVHPMRDDLEIFRIA